LLVESFVDAHNISYTYSQSLIFGCLYSRSGGLVPPFSNPKQVNLPSGTFQGNINGKHTENMQTQLKSFVRAMIILRPHIE
jgi:hypothetical protein